MNSSFGGGGNGSTNNPTNTPPPNPTTPFSHFPNSPHNNGNGRSDNNNNGRGRSQTDTTLHLNNNRSSKYSTTKEESQLEMTADYSNQPYKQRLYELFSLIEREMEAMHLENCALRARLEVQSKGGADRPVTELMETPRKRGNVADDLATQMNETFQSSFGGNEAEQKLSVGGGGKKSTQSRQQKWKSAFKNPSGKLALKVGANFPESKHRFVQSFKGHTDGVWQICAQQIGDSPVNVLGSASADQTAKIWLSDNGAQPLATYSGHNGSVNSIAVRPGHFGSNQMTFLTCSGDRNAHIWRLNLEQILERKREKNPTENEDEEFLSNFVQHIHQPLLKLTGHSDAIMSGDWLFGGDQIITASWDRTANLFDAENGKIMKTLSGHDRELPSCSSHPSQKLLATASRDFTFRLWDFREPIHSVAVFQGHNDSVTSVLFSAQWHIVSGSDDRTVKVWDLRNMRSPISAIRLDSAPNGIAICTQTQRNLLAIPMDNRNISIYDLNGNRQTRIPRSTGKCHHRLVTSCCWLPDHPVNNLVTAGFDKQIIGWKVHLPPQIAAGNKN